MRVLVISPHPDDESIGCGGTLRRHVESGDSIKVVFLTSGEGGGHTIAPDKTVHIREREAKAAVSILGIHDLEFWRLLDGKLRAGAITERLAKTIRSMRPGRIYVPHAAEAHADHRAACRAVARALSRIPKARPEVLTYEVWTPLGKMEHVVDISDQLAAKLRAIRAYRSQCRVLDFAAAARGLARYRGEMHCWPGGDYAEVFGEMRP